MKWFKRSVVYLKRNIKKIINLFLILFVLGNVLCVVSSLKTTSTYITNEIKYKVGPTVVYKDSRYNNIENGISDDEHLQNIYEYERILNDMMKHESVKYGNYSYIMHLEDVYDSLHCGYGLSSYPMVDVLENELQIVEGRQITKEEIEKGSYVVLVSEESLYNGKKIKLNDEIKMKIQNNTIHCSEEFGCEINEIVGDIYTLKVVGIFKKVEKVFDNQSQGFYDISNRWYIPNKTLIQIFEKKKNLINYDELISPLELAIDEPFIRLKNSDNLNQYIKDIQPLLLKENDKEGNRYDTLYTSNDEYMIISKPIQILSQLGNILLIGSTIIFSILLCILLISTIKERIYEIGIYLSLGERKYKVILQIFLELMIISMISVSCSLISGNLISEQVKKEIISQETLEEYEIETVEISKKEYYCSIYGCCLGIIVLSLIYPSIVVYKQNPKEIMLK